MRVWDEVGWVKVKQRSTGVLSPSLSFSFWRGLSFPKSEAEARFRLGERMFVEMHLVFKRSVVVVCVQKNTHVHGFRLYP